MKGLFELLVLFYPLWVIMLIAGIGIAFYGDKLEKEERSVPNPGERELKYANRVWWTGMTMAIGSLFILCVIEGVFS